MRKDTELWAGLLVLLVAIAAACSGGENWTDDVELGRSEQSLSYPIYLGYDAREWHHLPCDYEDSSHSCQVPYDTEILHVWTPNGGVFEDALWDVVGSGNLDLDTQVYEYASEPQVWAYGPRVRVKINNFGGTMGPAWQPEAAVHVYCRASTYKGRAPSNGAKIYACHDYGIDVSANIINVWDNTYHAPASVTELYRAAIRWGIGHVAGLPTKPGTGNNAMNQFTLPYYAGDNDFDSCQYYAVGDLIPGPGLYLYDPGTCRPEW